MRFNRKAAAGVAMAGVAAGTVLLVLWGMKRSKQRRRLRLVTDKVEPAESAFGHDVSQLAENEWVHTE